MSNQQRSLFDTSPEPWQQDAEEEMRVAEVVLQTGLEKPLDYCVPDHLADTISVGCRLRVPLGRGNRMVTGYCLSIESRPVTGRRLKPVEAVIDRRSLLTPKMIRLSRWIAEHYICRLSDVLHSILPAGVRAAAGTRQTDLFSAASCEFGAIDELKLPKKQRQVLQLLAGSKVALSLKQIRHACECTASPVHALRKKKLIDVRRERVEAFTHAQRTAPRESPLKLNDDQRIALAQIDNATEASRHETILIHGVTGSGKTEVYIQAIERIVQFGRQAIVLVPEISLTPQTRQRFESRFDSVAVLHSHLSDSQRHWHWQRIAAGEVQVVVGARSAVFAPTPHLGLIVMDEEHESSFKQDRSPRYHARDVARFRAREEKIPLVLGSATPSLESWHRAKAGEYSLVQMPRRVCDLPMPDVVTVDLRDEFQSQFSRGAISRPLRAAIEVALREKGQVILLLNRRGFSTHIQCPGCGEAVRCPECEITLTHHRQKNVALCHYCDFQMPSPQKCPACQFTGIRYSGLGTQRLEAEVNSRFPQATSLRMDTDTMRQPGSHERALDRFRSGEVQILLGTQMIAKGLDFPNVTLVGVINADTALHLPDFRAAERTFQLVTQVAGRTGRGKKGGRVLVQTFSPDHPAIQAAARHDFSRFSDHELPLREALGYPPFANIVRIVIRGPSEIRTKEFADQLALRIDQALEQLSETSVRRLGPAPAPFAKLRGKYRFQIHLHGKSEQQFRKALTKVSAEIKTPDDVQWIIDIDPLDML